MVKYLTMAPERIGCIKMGPLDRSEKEDGSFGQKQMSPKKESNMKHYALTFAVAVLGVLLAVAGIHAYNDHVIWHKLLDNIATQNAKAAAPIPTQAPNVGN